MILDFLFRLRRDNHVLCQCINLLKKYPLKKCGAAAFSTHETVHREPYIVNDNRWNYSCIFTSGKTLLCLDGFYHVCYLSEKYSQSSINSQI